MTRAELNRIRVKLIRLTMTERARLAGWVAWLVMGMPGPLPPPKPKRRQPARPPQPVSVHTMRAFEATLSHIPSTLSPVRHWAETGIDYQHLQIIGSDDS